jgi:hypothetical protein
MDIGELLGLMYHLMYGLGEVRMVHSIEYREHCGQHPIITFRSSLKVPHLSKLRTLPRHLTLLLWGEEDNSGVTYWWGKFMYLVCQRLRPATHHESGECSGNY